MLLGFSGCQCTQETPQQFEYRNFPVGGELAVVK